MNGLRALALILLLSGFGLLAASVASGEGAVHLVLFIPVFTGSGPLGLAGILCIFGAFASYFFGAVGELQRLAGTGGRAGGPGGQPHETGAAHPGNGMEPQGGSRVKGGGVVLIGPIPVIFGSDRKSLLYVQVAAVIILLIAVIIFLLGGL